MISSRLEPMSTTLMIDYRSDVWAACKCVGALLRCVLIRTGTRTGPATAALTAGAMKPLSGRAAAAAAAQLSDPQTVLNHSCAKKISQSVS